MWSDNDLDSCGIVWRWIGHITLVLVNLPAIFLNSSCFIFIFRLMILRKEEDLFTSIDRHDCSAVSNIGNVAQVPDNKDDDSARPASLNEVFLWPALFVSPLKEHPLGLRKSILDSNSRVLGEVIVSDNQLVELVPQEIRARSPSMAIVYREEGAPGPLFHLLELRLDDVQNNGHSVFIIVPDDTLMRVGSVATDDSVLLASELGWVVGLDEPIDLLFLHPHVVLLLLEGHNKPSVFYQLSLALRLAEA